jgi:hypothetical protein
VELGLPGCTVTPPSVFGCGVGSAVGGATGEPAQLVGCAEEDGEGTPALTDALLASEPKHGGGGGLVGCADGGVGSVVNELDGGVSVAEFGGDSVGAVGCDGDAGSDDTGDVGVVDVCAEAAPPNPTTNPKTRSCARMIIIRASRIPLDRPRRVLTPPIAR